ncbi:hypothetical protein BDW59DRAFT_172571 [Aspergillus cavernicola]|uniref:Peptidase M20 domain-containing protein 2 n=1 Tax=Aspergillus cavernicola TaxID=176166 RepID=A0ABR4IBS7_9EURO
MAIQISASSSHQQTIDARHQELWDINQKVAHDNITSLLRDLGFSVTPHAHGLETSFTAEYGSGGRLVAFNAEYDALPRIGHACGHNLITMMSIAAFLGLKIINAGGFDGVDACLMTHPGPPDECAGFTGDACMPTLANHKSTVRFNGMAVNALDAMVLGYNGISVLRQQIHPSDRVHCVVSDGETRPNVITGAAASLDCYVRSPTLDSANELLTRVRRCFDGAAIQTGCKADFTMVNKYVDLRPNPTMCTAYADAMQSLGFKVKCDLDSKGVPGSTDQGNVSYECPAFQAYVVIPAEPGRKNHTPGFTATVATREAHDLCIAVAKSMALVGWRVLADEDMAAKVKHDFEQDKKRRGSGIDHHRC